MKSPQSVKASMLQLDLANPIRFLQSSCLSRGSLQVLKCKRSSAGKVIGVERNTTEGLATDQYGRPESMARAASKFQFQHENLMPKFDGEVQGVVLNLMTLTLICNGSVPLMVSCCLHLAEARAHLRLETNSAAHGLHCHMHMAT